MTPDMTRSPEADSQLADFAGELTFRLDPFQEQACAALERGHGVLVCAPTGAGKTVVGSSRCTWRSRRDRSASHHADQGVEQPETQ